MREILFKAKRIETGEWVEGLLTVMWGQYHIINPDDENTAYPIDTETICQYTGLTDKDGRKIWENDILVMRYRDIKENGVVRYMTYNARFTFCDSDGAYGFDNDCDMEVIGNVFDNPELLKEGRYENGI